MAKSLRTLVLLEHPVRDLVFTPRSSSDGKFWCVWFCVLCEEHMHGCEGSPQTFSRIVYQSSTAALTRSFESFSFLCPVKQVIAYGKKLWSIPLRWWRTGQRGHIETQWRWAVTLTRFRATLTVITVKLRRKKNPPRAPFKKCSM